MTASRWQHVMERHVEVAPYLAQVKRTLDAPNLVYEMPSEIPTMAFYAKGLIADDHRFRGCYVAAIVRYKMKPAQVWTVYLPARLSNNQSRLIYASV